MPSTRTPKISPGAYSDFLRQIELEDIELLKGTIDRNRLPSSGSTLTYSVRNTRVNYEHVEHGFRATMHYLVKLGEEGVEEPFGEIRVVYSAVYRSEEKMTDDIFDVFSELNLPTNIYPYVREFVHSVTSKMGLPRLLLPMLKPWA